MQRLLFRSLFYISSLLLFYCFYKVEIVQTIKRQDYLFYYILFSLIIFFYFLFISIKKYSEYFFIIIISILGSFFLYEIYYVYSNKNKYFENSYHETEKKKYESKMNFYNKNKEQDDSSIIAYNPLIYYQNNQKLLPISHATNSNMILCNEGGYFSKWSSDRYGFNNDDAVWNSKKKKIILLGDSFVEGNCVNRPDNINSGLQKLNKKYNFVNYGISGSSLVHQFALLKEFWPKNVSKIFLFYYEGNDLVEIKDEMKNPIFSKYFKDNNFSQELMENIKKSDEVYRQVFKLHMENLENNFEFQRNYEISNNYSKVFISILKLTNSRNMINFLLSKKKISDFNDYEINLYEETLIKVKKFVEEKNSQLIFVYLPEYSRYNTFKYYKDKFYNYNQYNYKKIFDIINKNNIKIIDIHQLLFLKKKDPLECFPRKKPGHYNEKCYFDISTILNNSLN